MTAPVQPPDPVPTADPRKNAYAQPPTPEEEPWVVCNFIAWIAFGMAFGLWLYFCTDWFELFGSILAFGGVLAWLPFLFKLLSEGHQKRLQSTIGIWMFQSRWGFRIPIALLVMVSVLSACLAVLEVNNLHGYSDAAVYVGDKSAWKVEEQDRLPVGKQQRSLWWVWPWSSRNVYVKVAGLPGREFPVRCWLNGFEPREHVVIAGSLLRPLVIVGATPALIKEKTPLRLRILVKGQAKPVYDEPYKGHFVLIGSQDEDLPLPAALATMEGWSATAKEFPERFAASGVVRRAMDLRPGAEVSAELAFEGGSNSGAVWLGTTPIQLAQPTDVATMIRPLLIQK